MNDDVRIYLVDEYCEGASHFCFSERKDVVLLEDYEKLRAENEKLKAEIWKIESKQSGYEHFLRKENAKQKCLALNLFWRYAWVRSIINFSGSNECDHRCEWRNIADKMIEAWRKAKQELKEGSNA